MPGPPRPRRALVAALSIALLAVPAAPAVAATAAEIAVARDRVDRLSAELLQARSAAEGLGGAERAELERLERRLQKQKAELVRLESGLEARHAAESAAAAEEDDAAGDEGELTESPGAGEDDGPVVVLGDPPADDTDDAATQAVTPGTPGVIPLPDERRPAVVGDDATLARQIDGYLASKASPLTGLGAVFVTESRAVGLDPRFLVAIAGSETSFGTYGPSQTIHNPFGMGPHIVYASWSDGIRAAAQNLGGNLYKGSGLVTIPAIQARWAPHGASNDPTNLNSNWTRNVGIYYAEQGGDPNSAVFTSVAAAPVAGTAPADTPQAGLPVIATTIPVITPEPELGASGTGPEAAESALAQLGARTVRAGASPSAGFDAGGLVSWAYRKQGVTIPRDPVAQSRVGTEVEPADLEAGDAVFFSDPSGMIDHVGLYLGDGQFVHAAGPGETVTIGSLYEAYHAESYAGARRY
ncbi:MAG: C40 family peptidase [Thermoleophilia bacterium]